MRILKPGPGWNVPGFLAPKGYSDRMLASLRSAMFVKAMMVIVAAAFVGLIVLEWGADYSSTSQSSSLRPQATIEYRRSSQCIQSARTT